MNNSKIKFEIIAVAISTLLILLGLLIESNFFSINNSDLLLLIYGSAFIIGGFYKAKEGIEETIKNKSLNVEILMILASFGAFLIGEYFEGSILIFIFAVSGVLESLTKSKSEKNLTSLLNLTPKNANKKVGKKIITIDLNEVKVGDLIVVTTGEKIPVDGLVIDGDSSVDQSSITGEFIPKNISLNDQVYAGTINIGSRIIIKTIKDPSESVMQKMIDLVSKAQKQKIPKQSRIDKIEKWYVYIVILMSILFMIIPSIFGILSSKESFYRGIIILVVGSPCALVASISPAILSSLSSAARNNILIKGGLYLERLNNIDMVIFDKTGTITTGKPKVKNFIVEKGNALDPLTSIIYNMAKQSSHPISKAIVNHFFLSQDLDLSTKEIPGKGIECFYNENKYQIGRFNAKKNLNLGKSSLLLESKGQTIVWIYKNQKQIGFISLQDTIREDAPKSVNFLKSKKIDIMMLTGDNNSSAGSIANILGLDKYIANCYPEDKLNIITKNQKLKKVLMVGDGLNDAPALQVAELGISMGSGTDISLETADIIIMNNNLSSIPYLFKLSKKMNLIINQNIIFSLLIICLLLLSNVFGLIALPLGVLAHEGSTILVILNSLRLLKV